MNHVINDKLDRDSICWSLTDGCSSTYIYPEEVDYICDGLKLLKTRYNDLAASFARAGMPNSSNHIRLKLGNIKRLIELLGGVDDNNFSDITL